MDAGIATMVTAFIGFSAAGLISWRQLMLRMEEKKRSIPTEHTESNVA